ncbi:MAG: nucleotidyl transferase AbiEii/AbiGii toxin family protein [Patescibacteria group bacterium]|nr:nucleotidyl transferase AbiEii/AbiGii toxin family protein [Patescibacteria group bacterium]MBU4381384.1 nucleotidyl transferase AbiEii/AbiGii toxin family protein [Patescibacteria group bacterium]
MISQTDLINYSKIYKIDQYTVLREYLQIIFLNSLYKKKGSSGVVFKGGTAIRLIYESPRFSEDLDFNTTLKMSLLRSVLGDSLTDARKVFPKLSLKELNTTQGFSAKLFLENEISPMPLTVKLDFSMREKTIEKFKSTIATELPASNYSLIIVMTQSEILAEKLRTIFQRKKGRDIYDIWYLLNKKVIVDSKLLDEKFKLIDRSFDITDVIKYIASFDKSILEKDLTKYLPLDQRHLPKNLPELINDKLRSLYKI